MEKLVRIIFALAMLPVLLLVLMLFPKRRRELIWGPVPILNNKYWSIALRKAGWNTKTLMEEYYPSINRREDFDLYFEDLIPCWVWPSKFRHELSSYIAFLYLIRNASLLHIPFSGGPLGRTPLWRLESFFFRLAKIHTVLIPYGADIYRYSHIMDPSVRNGLLQSYPNGGREEEKVSKHIKYWVSNASYLIPGFALDGVGRWDILTVNPICIDTEQWQPKTIYSHYDGRIGNVRILHIPNHRGAKGTEFLVYEVEKLKAEGFRVELLLLEKVPNDRVKEVMEGVDILADQFIINGYGLAAIEGMASGLPVLSNLSNETYTRVFRRYGYLNECPILACTPESLKQNLMTLITNPKLREELGRAGRRYVEKYHSYETAQYLFGSIYKKIFFHEEVDLMNLFHPLISEYNRRKPMVQHPLIENRLPISEGKKC